MAGTLVVSTINSGNKAFNIDDISKGLAKAWVHFSGISGVVIKGSFNITSVVENSGGKYTLNFATPMNDAAFAVCGTAKRTDNTAAGTDNQSIFIVPSLYTTTSCHIVTCSVSAVISADIINVAIFD